MAKRATSFRCPTFLREKIMAIAKEQGITRSQVITDAIRFFARALNSRGGRLLPPYHPPDAQDVLSSYHYVKYPPDRAKRKAKNDKTGKNCSES